MTGPLYLSHPACLDHDTGGFLPERRERLVAIEAELARRDWLGYRRAEAPAATEAQLAAVHGRSHIATVRALAGAGGGVLDESGETPVGPGSWEAALHAAGGACALAEALMAGEATTGFCAVRPPGHHAAANITSGFCLFNNVAVAAQHALDACGARRVLIVDWDVHHGNGTNDIFRARRDVLFASIHRTDIYPGTGSLTDVGARDGAGFSINLPVAAGTADDVWLGMLEWIIVPAGEEYGPDLILISAGYDAHRDDPLGGCLLEGDTFAEMARHVRALGERLGVPVGAVLEGGYNTAALADSVAQTMAALASDEAPGSVAPGFLVGRAASHIGHHWTL